MAEQNIASTNTDKPLSGLLSKAPERAILVGVDMPGTDWSVKESLDELEQLATTAGVLCIDRVTQHLDHPHPGTLLGAGKVQEIADLVRFHNCDSVLFDLELTPGQHRNLERDLETQVIDRTALILMTSPATRTPLAEGPAAAAGRMGSVGSDAVREGRTWVATRLTYRLGEEGGCYGRTQI